MHTLNASPRSAAFNDCLRVIAQDDALLLIGDGVYAAKAKADTGAAPLLASGAEIYVLAADAKAAGISDFIEGTTCVDMGGFVALSERFPRQQAWY